MDKNCIRSFGKDSVELVYSELQSIHKQELDRFKDIETKSYYLLVFLGILVSIFTAIKLPLENSLLLFEKILLIGFIIVTLFVLTLVIITLLPRNAMQINNQALVDCDIYQTDKKELLCQLNEQYNTNIEILNKLNAEKQCKNRIALLGTAIDTVIVITFMLVYLFV